MRELSNWSLNIGLWGGVRIRLHASFLVVSVLGCYLAHLAGPRPNNEVESTVYGLLASAILLICVIVHEFGHGLAAWVFRRQFGSRSPRPARRDESSACAPRAPAQVITALAGPLANLLFMVALTPALLMQNVDVSPLLRQPLYPSGLLNGPLLLIGFKLAFWFNWLLFVVNLFPAAPLDGGRALRSILWPVMGYRAATRVVSSSGLVISLCLCVLCWFVYQRGDIDCCRNGLRSQRWQFTCSSCSARSPQD